MSMHRQDLVIIRPSDYSKVYGKLNTSLAAIEPPLWPALLAAYLRKEGHKVVVIDAEAEALSPKQTTLLCSKLQPRLIVFAVTGNNLSASTWLMTGTREYIKSLKKEEPDIKILLWGLHPSAIPQKTLKEENVDFVCQGEGFKTLSKLADILKNNDDEINYAEVPGLWYSCEGAIKNSAPAPLISSLDSLPSPAWDLLPMSKYRAHNWLCFSDPESINSYGVIYTSLGCPYDCSFCNLKALFLGKPGIRFRSPKKVIEDLGILVRDYNVKNVKVLDECFVLNERHVTEICDLIIHEGFRLNIWAYARVDTVNERILKKLKKSGFNWLCYGIESASSTVLTDVSQKNYSKNEIKQVIKMTKDAGINILGNFLFGLPEDNLSTMQETLDLAKELNCEFTNFYSTMAYPGSQLYEEALKNNIRLPENWRGYAAYSKESLPLPTKYLSGEEVLRFRDKAFVEFHSNPEYLNMIERKFGPAVSTHISDLLKHKLEREALNDNKGY